MPYSRRLNSNRCWCIFAVMSVACIISNFHQVGLAAVSEAVGTDLGADAVALAMLGAAFAYPYAAMQIPAGLLADTLGPRKSVTVSLLLVAFGTALFGFAPAVLPAAAARICIGIGSAVVLVPLMKLTAVWFPPHRYATLIAVAFTVGALGLLLATSPMAWAAGTIGWRSTYLLLAAATLAAALAVLFIVRDSHSPHSAENGKKSAAWIRSALTHIFSDRQTWILGLWCFFQAGIYFAFVGLWAGQFLIKGLDMTPQAAGHILALPACSLMVTPLTTWIADKSGAGNRALTALSLLTLLLSLPLVLGLPPLPPALLSAYLTIFCIAAISGTALVFAKAKERFGIEYAGTVSGFINIFPFFGAALLQQLIGLVLENRLQAGHSVHDAFGTAFLLLSVAAFAALLLSLLVRKPA